MKLLNRLNPRSSLSGITKALDGEYVTFKHGFPLLDGTSLNHRLLRRMEHLLKPFFKVLRLAQTSFRASCTTSDGKKEDSRMLEYVRWCNCVEELALGNCFTVSLRTRKYSTKTLSKTFCFLGVNRNVLSRMHFLKTSPFKKYGKLAFKSLLQFLPA